MLVHLYLEEIKLKKKERLFPSHTITLPYIEIASYAAIDSLDDS